MKTLEQIKDTLNKKDFHLVYMPTMELKTTLSIIDDGLSKRRVQ